MLKAQNVTVRYSQHTVVDNLSFHLQEGQWMMLIGPNGAGKSSLIEAIAQGVSYTGCIQLEGQEIHCLKPAQLARKIGVLSQRNTVEYAYTVEEIVGMGRYAHTPGFLSSDREGKAKVEEALRLTGLLDMRKKSILTLSGGETQRVFLAQVFAQDPQILLLDEPANHLDLVYQKHIFSLIQEWLKQPGRAVLSVVHDLPLARRFGTHAVLLHEGCCAAQGEMDEVLAPDHLREVYGMDVYAWMRETFIPWQDDGKACKSRVDGVS